MENAPRVNRQHNLEAREAARKEEHSAREAARREESLLRETIRKEDRIVRETTRQEDVAFRQASREMEYHARREDARLTNRRSALASAAVLCGKHTSTEDVLAMAEEFEAWIGRPDAAA